MRTFVLASGSPRRSDILTQLKVPLPAEVCGRKGFGSFETFSG